MVPGYEAWERGLALREAGFVNDAIAAFKEAGASHPTDKSCLGSPQLFR